MHLVVPDGHDGQQQGRLPRASHELAAIFRPIVTRHWRITQGLASEKVLSSQSLRRIERFALLTARRQEEITRIRWYDLHEGKGIARIRDLKHPTTKLGNDRWFRMTSPALVRAQLEDTNANPNLSPLVLPYDSKQVGAAFTRATRLLGIDDLRFHDLRHETTPRFCEQGYSIQDVAQLSLHAPWTSLKRYTHLRPKDVPER